MLVVLLDNAVDRFSKSDSWRPKGARFAVPPSAQKSALAPPAHSPLLPVQPKRCALQDALEMAGPLRPDTTPSTHRKSTKRPASLLTSRVIFLVLELLFLPQEIPPTVSRNGRALAGGLLAVD